MFQINVGSLALAANHNIKQIVDVCEEKDKETKLCGLLKEIGSDGNNKIIIFVETKKKVDDITKCIRREGYAAISIHGDKSQPERDYVLAEFRSGKSSILVATDVAARGLDVEDVKFVINFDYPNSSEDYVHRIGRTGRCQQAGTAYAFFTMNNQRQAKDLIAVLEEAGQVVTAQLQELAASARNTQTGRNRWQQNRNRDNSSPNSGGSLRNNKIWNSNKMQNGGDYRQTGPRMSNGSPRNDGMQRAQKGMYNNGGYQSYNNQYQQSGQSYSSNVYSQNSYQQNGGNRGYGEYYLKEVLQMLEMWELRPFYSSPLNLLIYILNLRIYYVCSTCYKSV